MKGHILTVLGYIVATFLTQGTSHFVIFAQHYAAVSFMRPDPVIALGFASMIVQGAMLSFVFTRSRFVSDSLFGAIRLAWLFGAFLVSYIALAEAGKYSVPSIPSWVGVEAAVGFVQYTLVGIFLGLAHGHGGNRVKHAKNPV